MTRKRNTQLNKKKANTQLDIEYTPYKLTEKKHRMQYLCNKGKIRAVTDIQIL